MDRRSKLEPSVIRCFYLNRFVSHFPTLIEAFSTGRRTVVLQSNEQEDCFQEIKEISFMRFDYPGC